MYIDLSNKHKGIYTQCVYKHKPEVGVFILDGVATVVLLKSLLDKLQDLSW